MSDFEGSQWSSRKESVKKSLEILEDVQNNYRSKLRQLNYFGTKKKVIQLKFEIFQDWIKYLQDENKLLAQLVIDLEEDVIKQCELLKQQQQQHEQQQQQQQKEQQQQQELKQKQQQQTSSQSSNDELSSKLKKYKNDLRNLLIFLKAVRENDTENIDLPFYFVRCEDLYGDPPIKYSSKSDDSIISNLKVDRDNLQTKNKELQKELSGKNRLLEEQETRIFELEERLSKQEKMLKAESVLSRRKLGPEGLLTKSSTVWEASKEVTNNMIQIWDKLVDKKVCEDKSSSNCHVVMDKNDNALESLQQAVTQITKELQAQGTISKQSQGDALLFIVFDKNKET